MTIYVMRETEAGGVKSYTVQRSLGAVSHGSQVRPVEIGGAITDSEVTFFTTAFTLTVGTVVRINDRLWRVTNSALIGLAGLKRYEAVEVSA